MNMANKAEQQLKVSVIEPVGGHGGMDYYDFGLCDGLASSGAGVTLYTSDKTVAPARVRFHLVRSFKGVFGKRQKWVRAVWYFIALIRTFRLVLLNRSRVCHFHFFHVGAGELVQMLVAKLFRQKIVVTVHDVAPLAEMNSRPAVAKWAYGLANLIITHNQWSKDDFLKQFRHYPASKVMVIPHGHYIDTMQKMPRPSEARARLRIPVHRKVLLFFGQIKKTKGLDLLIEALAGVKISHPDILLVIAGKVWKDDFDRYQQIITDLNLQPFCLQRIEYIPNHEVRDYFSAADIVVLPYRKIYQSGVLLMAMSCRKPVLVSDLPGMTEVVTDGVTGFIYKNKNSASLGQKISDLLEDFALLYRVAQTGYDTVRVGHDWKVIGKTTLAAYLSMFRKKRAFHADSE